MEAQQTYRPPDSSGKQKLQEAGAGEKVCSKPLASSKPSVAYLTGRNQETSSSAVGSEVFEVRGSKAHVALPKIQPLTFSQARCTSPSTLSPRSASSAPRSASSTSPRSVSSTSSTSASPKFGCSTPRSQYRLAPSPIAEEVEKGQSSLSPRSSSENSPDASTKKDGKSQRKPQIPEKPRFFPSSFFLTPKVESPGRNKSTASSNGSHPQSLTPNKEASLPRPFTKFFQFPNRSPQTTGEDRTPTDYRENSFRPETKAKLQRRSSRDLTFSLSEPPPRPLSKRSRPGEAQRKLSIKPGIPQEADETDVEDISIIHRIYLRAAADLNSNDAKKVEHARLMLHRLKQAGFEARPKSLSHPLPASSPTITVTVAPALSPPTAASTPLKDRPSVWPADENGRESTTSTPSSGSRTDLPGGANGGPSSSKDGVVVVVVVVVVSSSSGSSNSSSRAVAEVVAAAALVVIVRVVIVIVVVVLVVVVAVVTTAKAVAAEAMTVTVFGR
ncbi:hypothetical protein ElyMa_003787500 [Elysia marginata]|uniref:Uncharacterized protein n=1 Tax=Elysia marginata TaxID=1093978 RepID=A0AAV4FCT2_9GAST|nr:hypothetical protein ElyMa_003787500 [Elysia marginata]